MQSPFLHLNCNALKFKKIVLLFIFVRWQVENWNLELKSTYEQVVPVPWRLLLPEFHSKAWISVAPFDLIRRVWLLLLILFVFWLIEFCEEKRNWTISVTFWRSVQNSRAIIPVPITTYANRFCKVLLGLFIISEFWYANLTKILLIIINHTKYNSTFFKSGKMKINSINNNIIVLFK